MQFYQLRDHFFYQQLELYPQALHALNKAIDLDGKYKEISTNDLEFKKYVGNTLSSIN